jgi:hypothetical protein
VIIAGFLQNGDLFSSISIPQMGLLSLVIVLVSFWGIIIILDANFWQNRNLWFISNIEWKFLGKGGIGKVLPASYATPNFHYSRIYAMHMQLLLIIILAITLGNAGIFMNPNANLGFLEDVVIGLFGILVSGFSLYLYSKDKLWVEEYYQVRGSAIGDRAKLINYGQYYKYKNQWESPIVLWILGLSLISSLVNMNALLRAYNGSLDDSMNKWALAIIVMIMLTSKTILSTSFRRNVAICRNYMKNEISEEELSIKPQYKKIQAVAVGVSKVIEAFCWISIIISVGILLKAFI